MRTTPRSNNPNFAPGRLSRVLTFVLTFLVLLCLPVRLAAQTASAGAPVAYASFSATESTLTFHYGNMPAGQSEELYVLYPESLADGDGDVNLENPGWGSAVPYGTKTVIFDESFKDARLKSCQKLFSGFSQLTTFKGWENLNTSEVTSMAEMFAFCTAIQSLDLSGFSTAKVTDMSQMFNYCQSLVSLDLSGFNTSEVVNMSNMFRLCIKLKELDLSGFNTANVTDMSQMFSDCQSLASLDLSGFNTEKVKYMSSMFYDCYSLKKLDLSNFKGAPAGIEYMFANCFDLRSLDITGIDTKNVESMMSMFSRCGSLTSLDLRNFNTKSVQFMSRMFADCYSLLTVRVNAKIFKPTNESSIFEGCKSVKGNYGPGNSFMADTYPFVCVDGSGQTVTFYTAPVPDTGSQYFEIDTTSWNRDVWYGLKDDAKKVVFDESFKEARPTSLALWFDGFEKLESIEGMENLCTDSVRDMSGMFGSCKALASLNLSSFNTASVETMESMFKGCASLKVLDLSSFNTGNVNSMVEMFSGCTSLDTIRVTGCFTTGQITDPRGTLDMFAGCPATGNYGLDNRLTAELVPSVKYEFNIGTGARTVTFTMAPKVMPSGTDALKHVAINLADGQAFRDSLGSSVGNDRLGFVQTAVFDESFKDVRPTSCRMWFWGFQSLAAVKGLENLNTSDVTDMSCMFGHCKSLTSLDLSHFNTAHVEDFGEMLRNCEGIQSLDLSVFSTNTAVDTHAMFSQCFSLKSVKLPSWENAHGIHDMSAMFFECKALQELDLRSLRLADGSCQYMYNMFKGCVSLKKILATTKLLPENANITNMFDGCTRLTGNYGPDNKLTVAFAPRAVWTHTDKMLTFKQVDEVIDGNAENSFAVLNTGEASPAWIAVCAETLQTAVFDESFKEVRPASCYEWFRGCTKLSEVKGLENLNTSATKYVRGMFRECSSLTTIDLSGLDFGSVTTGGVFGLFKNCTSLITANLSGLNAAQSAYGMFTGCTSLKQVDFTGFNTSKVTQMDEMFKGCTSLEELDLTSFSTEKLTNMEDMFSDCTSLKTIYVSDAFNIQGLYNSQQPFRNCSSLRGAVAFADVTDNKKKNYIEMANYMTGYFKTYYKVGDRRHDITVKDGALHVDNLQLEDGQDFVACAPFTAGTVTHTRQLNGGGEREAVWGSLCLPYSLKPGEAGLTCYTLDGVNYGSDGDGIVYVRPLEGGTLPAGTPAFFKADAGTTTLNLGASDVEVVRQPLDGETEAKGGVYLRGDFVQYDIAEGYALMSNSLWNISAIAEQQGGDGKGYKVSSKGFRAYLAPAGGNLARARQLRFVASDEEATSVGDGILDAAGSAPAEYFDVSGRKLPAPGKGIIIVRHANGKITKQARR